MKLVDRKTLMAMPAGTIYCEWVPSTCYELIIKGDTIYHGTEPNDWFNEGDLSAAFVNHDALEAGLSDTPDFYTGSRDACFDDSQLYAVFDRADVQALIQRLREAEAKAYGGAQ